MKKVILFALLVASVSVSTAVLAQSQKNTGGQPVKSLTATSAATAATKGEVAKKELKSDKKEVKKEAPKTKKESKPASTSAK